MASSAMKNEGWADIFLSAALEPHLWADAIQQMAQATGSRHGQLIGFGPGAADFNWISDIDQSVFARTAAIDQGAPDLNFRVAADRLPDRPDIVHEAHYDVARQALRADDYLDLCSDFDIFDGCQTRLLADASSMIGLALLRDSKDGRTSPEQRDLFAAIAGHARTAVRLQQAIEQQGFALLAGTFEALDRACWLLDGTGRVGGMTPRAETLLAGSRLRVTDGWLASDRADESRAILRSMRRVIEPSDQPADPVPLADDSGGVAILLEFYPLPARPWSLPFAPRAIALARVSAATDRHVQLLMRTFRLTRAEADIAIRLAAGQNRREIAVARSVSTETLKVQLRSIYDKTGCSREAQLVRLVGLIIH
ncbi:MAG TPA: helix-turn-helix transcriptional regulator [Sphingobium sp.]|uniref:helix-turn-helix transcriptional regulator n=1 Tax=unclassified Sphingobium TaxID=2611147 RepID=UPI0007F448B2|nr:MULTISPECIES: helix-turn-helix transcriptional regulator [unclassified Sphingobium]OAN51970.1 helix-turn-helix transcriptional regulator [Sphingobium sp. TCM1]WIW88316.1 helix-turn-helix transcriptional regulator [Sphingobium sp. V4]HAF41237.1 helix-turn-helix transcriptional regulator [Sphingobium sp.]